MPGIGDESVRAGGHPRRIADHFPLFREASALLPTGTSLAAAGGRRVPHGLRRLLTGTWSLRQPS
jgi:hypothetical protein